MLQYEPKFPEIEIKMLEAKILYFRQILNGAAQSASQLLETNYVLNLLAAYDKFFDIQEVREGKTNG